jgi:methionine synthase II (cobalamin-independent)
VANLTQSIASIPKPRGFIEAARILQSGRIYQLELQSYYESAVQDAVARFEPIGSPVVTDGEPGG